LASVALFLHEEGRYAEVEKFQLKLLEIRKRILGLDHRDALVSILNLSATYTGQGRYKEAETLQLQVVDMVEKNGRLDDPEGLAAAAL
jgi:hypothetical protein